MKAQPYPSSVQARAEGVMVMVTQGLQMPRCQRCASTSVYVECLEPSPIYDDLDVCQCRCGMCGGRFEILSGRDDWFIPCLMPTRGGDAESWSERVGHPASDAEGTPLGGEPSPSMIPVGAA
jgi:hypothetical protein